LLISLINEALKRLEADERQRIAGGEPVPPPPMPKAVAPRASARPRTETVLLATVLVICAAAGIWVWRSLANGLPEQATAAMPQEARLDVPPVAAQVSAPPVRQEVPKVPAPSAAVETRKPKSAAKPANGSQPPSLRVDLPGSADSYLETTRAEAPAPPERAPVPPAAPAAGPASPGPAHDAHAPPQEPPATPKGKPEDPAPPPAPPKFQVTSIAASATHSAAVINGHIVTVGDTIEGAKVVAITPQTVELDVAGRRVTLNF
jgi:cytoskeletal protein RodZ